MIGSKSDRARAAIRVDRRLQCLSLAFVFLAIFILLAAPTASYGQTFWIGGTDDWNASGNWTLGVPSAASGTAFDAVIENGGTAQLLEPPNGSVRRLRIGRAAGGGNVLVDAVTLTVTENLHLNETSAAPATMTVRNGGTVSSPSTVVGFSSTPTTDFLITDAGSSVNAATQFIVGNSGAGTASLTVENGGVLTSGTGSVGNGTGATGVAVVRNPGSKWMTTGAFTVGNLGTGTLTIEDQGLVHVGTSLSISGTSTVNLNGGTLRFNTSVGASLNRLVYSSGTIQLAGNRILDSDLTIAYLFGPLLSPPASITIPSGKGLTVEGTAFLMQPTKSTTVSGGTLTAANMVFGNILNGVGTLIVNNGGTVNTSLNVTMGDVSGSSGIATLSGAGSSWNIGGSATIGSSGTATLNIQDQSLVYVESGLSINGSSAVNLQGGTLRFNTISGVNRINFSAGTIQLAGGRSVGVDTTIQTLFGASPLIPTGKGLVVEGVATLTKPVRIDGGVFKANGVAVGAGGAIEFDRGVLEIGAGGVTGVASLVVPANGELRVSGVQTTRITALAGSTITATSYLTLGDDLLPNGFYTNGDLNVGPWAVLLADANDAVLDSAANVTLGATGVPGELLTSNSLTLDFGGNIVGYGTVTTVDSAATPFINNGHITGTSPEQPITLAGYVKGVGTLDNVVITGTDAPGFSPANLVRGSVVYEGVLEIEIGGTAPGSFDQIHHLLGMGLADLGGTLDVKLLNGFTPALNDAFEIITAAGGVSGVFESTAEALPALSSGLSWAINYNADSVLLQVVAAGLPGDYNQNGTVDSADYTVWRDNLGSATSLPNDDSPGVDFDDYARWKTHFGAPLGSGAILGDGESLMIPEPSLCILAVSGVVGVLALRKKKRGCPAGRFDRASPG